MGATAGKPRLLRFAEFQDELDDRSPLKLAALRSRALREKRFFVYSGDMAAGRLKLDLDAFPRTGWDGSMCAYPVILGNIVADELYFHGCAEGDVTARNLYCERFHGLRTPSGCAGTLDVAELCYVHADTLAAGERAVIHTAVLAREAALSAPLLEIGHTFTFPSLARGHDWSHHSLDELKRHFRDRVIDGIDRLETYFGVDVEAMIPMRPSFSSDGPFQWIRRDEASGQQRGTPCR